MDIFAEDDLEENTLLRASGLRESEDEEEDEETLLGVKDVASDGLIRFNNFITDDEGSDNSDEEKEEDENEFEDEEVFADDCRVPKAIRKLGIDVPLFEIVAMRRTADSASKVRKALEVLKEVLKDKSEDFKAGSTARKVAENMEVVAELSDECYTVLKCGICFLLFHECNARVSRVVEMKKRILNHSKCFKPKCVAGGCDHSKATERKLEVIGTLKDRTILDFYQQIDVTLSDGNRVLYFKCLECKRPIIKNRAQYKYEAFGDRMEAANWLFKQLCTHKRICQFHPSKVTGFGLRNITEKTEMKPGGLRKICFICAKSLKIKSFNSHVTKTCTGPKTEIHSDAIEMAFKMKKDDPSFKLKHFKNNLKKYFELAHWYQNSFDVDIDAALVTLLKEKNGQMKRDSIVSMLCPNCKEPTERSFQNWQKRAAVAYTCENCFFWPKTGFLARAFAKYHGVCRLKIESDPEFPVRLALKTAEKKIKAGETVDLHKVVAEARAKLEEVPLCAQRVGGHGSLKSFVRVECKRYKKCETVFEGITADFFLKHYGKHADVTCKICDGRDLRNKKYKPWRKYILKHYGIDARLMQVGRRFTKLLCKREGCFGTFGCSRKTDLLNGCDLNTLKGLCYSHVKEERLYSNLESLCIRLSALPFTARLNALLEDIGEEFTLELLGREYTIPEGLMGRSRILASKDTLPVCAYLVQSGPKHVRRNRRGDFMFRATWKTGDWVFVIIVLPEADGSQHKGNPRILRFNAYRVNESLSGSELKRKQKNGAVSDVLKCAAINEMMPLLMNKAFEVTECIVPNSTATSITVDAATHALSMRLECKDFMEFFKLKGCPFCEFFYYIISQTWFQSQKPDEERGEAADYDEDEEEYFDVPVIIEENYATEHGAFITNATAECEEDMDQLATDKVLEYEKMFRTFSLKKAREHMDEITAHYRLPLTPADFGLVPTFEMFGEEEKKSSAEEKSGEEKSSEEMVVMESSEDSVGSGQFVDASMSAPSVVISATPAPRRRTLAQSTLHRTVPTAKRKSKFNAPKGSERLPKKTKKTLRRSRQLERTETEVQSGGDSELSVLRADVSMSTATVSMTTVSPLISSPIGSHQSVDSKTESSKRVKSGFKKPRMDPKVVKRLAAERRKLTLGTRLSFQ